MNFRKQTRRMVLISELSALQTVQAEKPSWFKSHDYDRLARSFAEKSAELVSLEIKTHRKRIEPKAPKQNKMLAV